MTTMITRRTSSVRVSSTIYGRVIFDCATLSNNE